MAAQPTAAQPTAAQPAPGDAVDADGRGVLPLACTLGPDDGPARLRRWRRLHETADPVVRLADGALEVSYRPDPGVRTELETLAAAERGCCAFVAWSVTDSDGLPVLHVTAPPGRPDALAPILSLFEALVPAGPPVAPLPAGSGARAGLSR